MEQVVEQHRLESKTFEVKMNQVLNENERLLEQVINKDIVNIIMNSSVDNAYVNVHDCEKCLKHETELLNKKYFIKKETYDKLFRSFTTLKKYCISLEVDTQLNQEIFQRDNSVSNQSALTFDHYFELNELKAQSQEKDTVIKKLKERIKSLSGNMNKDKVKKDIEEIETINIKLDHREKDLVITALKNELRKLKGKDLANNVVTKHHIAPEMLKIDLEPIAPRLLNNRTAHSDYLRHIQEQAAILREIVEQGKLQNLLNNSLDSACKYTKQIQELLILIGQTYLSINNSREKLVAVTLKNKGKKVRFTEPVTSSGNTNKKTASSSNLVSNKPMLSSTGVKPSTSASRSQPSDNTKKDKIQRTPSSSQKNQVEAHPRTVKSSLKNKKSVVEPKRTANVQHSKLNANSKLLCVKCNGCMLSDNHDLCVLDFINDVNTRAKSKSVKKIRNVCSLTRITTTAEVPLKKPTALESDTPKPVVTLVYSRKPRKSKTNALVSKPKIVKSISANKKEPNKSWESIVSDVPSSSLDEFKFRNDHVAKILGYSDYHIGNVTISRHTCFIRNLEVVDLLTGSRGNNLYTLSLGDMMASYPIYLLSKASKTKSWLWHQRLSHLNFDAINHLARHGLVRVMSSASSAVTYTSVYTDSELGRVFWGANEEISDGDVPRVIVYGYNGLPMQPVDPPSPDYVPGPEHPASPDYVPSPEHPPSPIEIPFVPKPEYPEYLVPSKDEAPMEDQPLPADASPLALSPGYVPDSDLEEDPEEDSEEEHADYPTDGGDGDDDPFGDDTDDDDADDDDEEPFEDDEEEEEHLAPADSLVTPVVDPVPPAGDTEAFETDESAPTPRPPQIRIPFAQTRLRRARKSVRPEPPMSASMEARIAEHAAALTPPLPVVSLPLPLPSPLTTSPTDAGAPLGYRAAGIRMRAAAASPPSLLPPTSPRTDIPEAEMPPRKRACLTTPAPGYEIGESSAAGAARQPGPTPALDTWDEIVEAMMEIAPTTLEGVDQRVTELDTTVRQRTEEFEIRFEEAHDDRAYLGALVNTLYRDRLQHHRTALAMDREAVYARIAWTSSEERSAAIEAHVRTLEAQVATLITQTTSLQTQLTTALGRIATLEARDPEPQDGPAEAGSSS
ncbi:retrovirus-related pol polyprotein from transposon TNT 1-94 [Tanacetum coccineum]